MIEQDTVRLLRECDAGVKMGVDSLEDVLDRVRDNTLQQLLSDCKGEHVKLEREIEGQLARFADKGKEPNPVAKGMSHMKTGMKMAMDDTDQTVADLITDGCNMGVKSLSRYLNEYKAADEYSKDIAKRLIAVEAKLGEDLRMYL